MDLEKKIKDLELALKKCYHDLNEQSTLISAMELINSAIDLNTVLDYLMDVAKKITEAEAASALLLEGDRLCFVAASGVKSGEIKKIYIDKGEGIAGWVLEHGEPLLVPEVSLDPRFSSKTDKRSGFVTRSVVAVPLKMDDRVIGVIEAVNKIKGGQFNDNDARLLASLAASAAMAVHKAQMYRDLNDLFLSTIKAMVNAIEAKDKYTRGHSERIRDFSLIIARELALSQREQKDIEVAALLHDVGKIGVPEAVLLKQGKLTDEEFNEIKKHPTIGADMLSSIKQLSRCIPGIRHHQEHYNGRGYPAGLAGEKIPLAARIIAVADTFDAMTSDRPYRKGLPDEVALKEIEKFSGIQFDPQCAAAFLSAYQKGLIKSQRLGNPEGRPSNGEQPLSGQDDYLNLSQ